MHQIKRSARVGYTPQQMFDLVNNVKDYPLFLPWCQSSTILSQTAHEMEASLEIAWSGIRKQFTTRNRLTSPHQIDLHLVNGPFRHLEGTWQFKVQEGKETLVTLALEFELAGNLFDRLFQPVFYYITNSMVDAFCQRASLIYGTH